MRNIPTWIAIVSLATLTAACADLPKRTSAMLTYESKPEGAHIFEGGKDLGQAPVMRTYEATGQAANITTPDVVAIWPSGAKTTYFTILPLGADRVATLQRPASAPGLQTDLDHAKEVIATAQREAERIKATQANDIARMSARCQAQIAKGSNPAADDCH